MDIKPPQPYSHDEIAAALTLIDLSSSPRAQAQLLQQAHAQAQLAQQQVEAQKHYSNDMDTSETGSATLVETLPALQINTDPRLQTSPPMTHASSTHQIPPSPLTQSPLLQTNVENISPNQLSAAQQLLSTLSRDQQQQLQHQININHQQISQQQLIQTTTLEQQQQAANAAVASALASVAAQQHKEQIIRATMAGSPTINTISHGPISINTNAGQHHHHHHTSSIPILKQNFGVSQLISTPTQLLHKQQAVAAAQRIVPNTQQQQHQRQQNGGIQQGSIILSSSPNPTISTSAPINSGQLAAAQHFLLQTQEHQNQNTLTASSLQANNSIPITIQKAAAAKLIQNSHHHHALGGSLPFNNSDSLFGSAGQSPPKTTTASHHPYLTNPTIKLLQNQSRQTHANTTPTTTTTTTTATDGTTGLPITIRSKATSSGSIPSFGVGSLPTMSNHQGPTQGVQVINGQPQFTTGGFVQQMPILGNGGGPIEPRRRTISNSGTRKRGDSKKCRKVFGIENKDQWCKACIWKKACQRFPD